MELVALLLRQRGAKRNSVQICGVMRLRVVLGLAMSMVVVMVVVRQSTVEGLVAAIRHSVCKVAAIVKSAALPGLLSFTYHVPETGKVAAAWIGGGELAVFKKLEVNETMEGVQQRYPEAEPGKAMQRRISPASESEHSKSEAAGVACNGQNPGDHHLLGKEVESVGEPESDRGGEGDEDQERVEIEERHHGRKQFPLTLAQFDPLRCLPQTHTEQQKSHEDLGDLGSALIPCRDGEPHATTPWPEVPCAIHVASTDDADHKEEANQGLRRGLAPRQVRASLEVLRMAQVHGTNHEESMSREKL
mmetsp:Transcript_73632/g.172765  ORF Transcript_73632/g.172765 Transcript_73632/m.172765 type:complete len:304 (-) Transcript_73632:796-1707(-)